MKATTSVIQTIGHGVWVPAFAGTTASSSQCGLEIETQIRGPCRFDRAVEPKDLSAEHVIRGAVDRFDADQLARPVAECRERSLPAIAAHHDLVISGGEPCDLQFVVALVAPEP